ncbi:armadillo-type protein [Mycena galericulata]|nr:armadillo-type protein [Mycena galericulata]
MPPLNRQQSRASIYSWWSDSNPGLQGATINLHTVAKPLIKLMYHRQARGLIQRNGDIPLSSEMLEIYSTYFLCKYVSHVTQGEILWHVAQRVRSENDACAIVDSPICAQIPQLFESADRWVRADACVLVRYLARHESSLAAILAAKLFDRLVSHLWDTDSHVIQQAIAALANIACWPDGARAVINSNTLPQLPELLKSASKWVRVNACILVRNLACHESSLAAILATNSIERLVSTLQHADFRVIQEATYALAILAYWADGAHAIIKSLPQLSELLESANDWVRLNACTLIRNLARHDSSLAAILAANPFERLVSLLSEKNALVMEEAIYALMQASWWLDGAQATVDAMGVYHIPELLKSANSEILQRTCWLVGILMSHKSTVLAVLASKPCSRLVELLCDTNIETRATAASALTRISEHPDGVTALVGTAVMQALEEMGELSDNNEKHTILENLTRHQQARKQSKCDA